MKMMISSCHINIANASSGLLYIYIYIWNIKKLHHFKHNFDVNYIEISHSYHFIKFKQ